MRIGLALIFTFLLTSVRADGPEVASNKSEAMLHAVFTPPDDAIETPPVDILGINDVAHLDIGRVISGQKTVIAIPLSNKSTANQILENVSSSCGCMAAIADDVTLAQGESKQFYIILTPGDVGELGKKSTLIFQSGFTITVVIKGRVEPAFAVTPRRISLSVNGAAEQLLVKPNLDVGDYEVSILNSAVVTDGVTNENNETTLRCALKSKDPENIPFEMSVPVVVSFDGGESRYILQILNKDAIEVVSKTAIASFRDGRYRARVMLRSFDIRSAGVYCEVAAATGDETVVIDEKLYAPNYAIYHLSIVDESESARRVTLNWKREGSPDVIATSEVVLRM